LCVQTAPGENDTSISAGGDADAGKREAGVRGLYVRSTAKADQGTVCLSKGSHWHGKQMTVEE
jgi:hypothetical protein